MPHLQAMRDRAPVGVRGVLGAAAAQRMGIDTIFTGERIWAGGMWFYVTGILKPAALAPEIDSSVLVGYPAAQKYLHFNGHPTTIYLPRPVVPSSAAINSVWRGESSSETSSVTVGTGQRARGRICGYGVCCRR